MGPKGKTVATHRATNGLRWQNLGDLSKKSDFWPMNRFRVGAHFRPCHIPYMTYWHIGEQSAENEKSLFLQNNEGKCETNGGYYVPEKSIFGHSLNFWAFSIEMTTVSPSVLAGTQLLYHHLYFWEIEVRREFRHSRTKTKDYFLPNTVYVLRNQELLLTNN